MIHRVENVFIRPKKVRTQTAFGLSLSMGYKKDIFGIFAYEFELLPKNLELSNLVGGGEPPSVDQWLHHFETAYKNHRDLFLGIYRYAFEQLSYDLLIILHRSVFQPVQNGIYIVES